MVMETWILEDITKKNFLLRYPFQKNHKIGSLWSNCDTYYKSKQSYGFFSLTQYSYGTLEGRQRETVGRRNETSRHSVARFPLFQALRVRTKMKMINSNKSLITHFPPMEISQALCDICINNHHLLQIYYDNI